MADRGWHAIDVERASAQTGHPLRTVSYRTVYRVISDGFVPTDSYQFEIAATFGLLPSHIWGVSGRVIPLPEPYAYLNERQEVMA